MPQYQPGTPQSDQVPLSGLWQTDPTVQAYLAKVKARPQNAARGTAAAADPQRQSDDLAFSRYIESNRRRLGIPNNYWPDPRTGGQTLYDPNNNQLRDAAITGGALAAGGYGLGALLGPAAVTAPTASTTAGTVGGFSIAPPTVALGGSAALPTAVGTGGSMAGGLWGTGLTYADLIGGGADWFGKLYSAHAASSAADKNDEALKAALEFAKQQYADTTKREQERWDATEARRVPYRAASQDTLREFRKLLGI